MTARPVVTSGLDYDPVLACRHLSDADPMLGALIARVGPCLLRPRQTQSLFAAVARAIVLQQLSGSAAATILGRGKALYAPKRVPTPHDSLAPPPARLYEFPGAASGAIRQNLELSAFMRETGLRLAPLSVLQEPASGVNDGLLRQWAQPALGVNTHYGYAFQWFALSALMAGLYVWFQLVRPRLRRSA